MNSFNRMKDISFFSAIAGMQRTKFAKLPPKFRSLLA